MGNGTDQASVDSSECVRKTVAEVIVLENVNPDHFTSPLYVSDCVSTVLSLHKLSPEPRVPSDLGSVRGDSWGRQNPLPYLGTWWDPKGTIDPNLDRNGSKCGHSFY